MGQFSQRLASLREVFNLEFVGAEADLDQVLPTMRRHGVLSVDDGDGDAMVQRPLRPFWRPVLTEMYLCDVCSCHEILRRNGRGQMIRVSSARTFSLLSSIIGPCVECYWYLAKELPRLVPADGEALKESALISRFLGEAATEDNGAALRFAPLFSAEMVRKFFGFLAFLGACRGSWLAHVSHRCVQPGLTVRAMDRDIIGQRRACCAGTQRAEGAAVAGACGECRRQGQVLGRRVSADEPGRVGGNARKLPHRDGMGQWQQQQPVSATSHCPAG
eukprot:COSAG01_NODE_2669_length_7278_cov_3.791057_5_plen_275_part_00